MKRKSMVSFQQNQVICLSGISTAPRTLAGIEIVRMIKKEQVDGPVATTYFTLFSLAV